MAAAWPSGTTTGLPPPCRTGSRCTSTTGAAGLGYPPAGRDGNLETDIGDLAAVLEHTGARSIFGHSGGGFVALRAGLSLPLDRIAVYDPGLSILGRPSFDVLRCFRARPSTKATTRGR